MPKTTKLSLLILFIIAFLVPPKTLLGQSDPVSIQEARQEPLGTVVTVAGRVTVTDEFEGPVYFQDETGGLAWFNFDKMRDAFTIDIKRGDSLLITGKLGDFNDLLQIDDDNDAQFQVFGQVNKEVQPEPISVSQMNSGDFESQLVSMNVDIDHSGALQGNTNYIITDDTGSGEIRINGDTNIVGAQTPEGVTTVVGVIGVFRGTFQLLPRDLNDIDTEAATFPGDDISKDNTFEVVTWNIEWFGSASNGPDDEAQQLQNVKTVIDSVDADLYAFQEIASIDQFNQLLAELPEYGGFMSSYPSQVQETAFLFKRSTIDSLDSGVIEDSFTTSNWAGGRFPLMFNFRATINGQEREIFAFTIHAKAFDDQSSYNQRFNASIEFKDYLDQAQPNSNVIFLGDYNDTVTGSITSGNESPYKNFVDDSEYTVVTQNLEDGGFSSQASGSFIDHITFTSELADEYFVETERVENTSYIGSYLSTTSDHFPVWVRFDFNNATSNDEFPDEIPRNITLNQNYPNPFNPSTVISYSLDKAVNVQLEVFNLLGRKVATLVDGRQTAGQKTVSFDGTGLSSGVYVYRLSTEAGVSLTRKMLLIK